MARAWEKLTALELLLRERLRRAEVVVDETAEEQRLRLAVKAAIQSRFVVTRSRRHCVRLRDVQSVGVAVPGARRALVTSVALEMGGLIARPRNLRMLNGFRHLEHTDVEGVAYAKSLRADPWAKEHAGYWNDWAARTKRRAKWKDQ